MEDGGRSQKRMAHMSITATRKEQSLYKYVAKMKKMSMAGLVRSMMYGEARRIAGGLTGEELVLLLELVDECEAEAEARAQAVIENAREMGNKIWDKKTGLSREERKRKQLENRYYYRHEWYKNKKEKNDDEEQRGARNKQRRHQ